MHKQIFFLKNKFKYFSHLDHYSTLKLFLLENMWKTSNLSFLLIEKH